MDCGLGSWDEKETKNGRGRVDRLQGSPKGGRQVGTGQEKGDKVEARPAGLAVSRATWLGLEQLKESIVGPNLYQAMWAMQVKFVQNSDL